MGAWAGKLVHAETLPPELAFIPPEDVPSGVLRQVARQAEIENVTAEQVLLAAGHMTADRFYRLLALHLGLPYAEHPLRPVAGTGFETARRSGSVPLAPNARGWTMLMAPTGPILRACLARQRPDGRRCAVTTPERLDALVRHASRQAVSREASHGLPDWNEALSARGGMTAPQIATAWLLGLGIGTVALAAPGAGFAIASVLCYVGFLLNASLRLVAAAMALPVPDAAEPRQPDDTLPVYTIIVPLYCEAREVDRLSKALGRLDYPRSKLDIVVMIEPDDRATLRAIDRLRLPACYRVIMAPPGRPQTKPRALNVGLQFARGRFLVVYDAEDDPEPQQLRKALARFRRDPGVACLQAQLAVDNRTDSWVTRLFTLEYAALFHAINPGLAALQLPIPLGGTSNHFRVDVLRRVNGWDAWNVTEDIDLGIRLARFGHRVGVLDSVTLEEAPQTIGAWLTQRRRWQKGWIMTFVTHSRNPLRCWRELGWRNSLGVSALLFGSIMSSLLGPLCVTYLGYRLVSGRLLHPLTGIDLAWSAMSLVLLLVGLASALWPAWLGVRRRRTRRLFPWTILLPLYFALLSLAAWQALFEIAWRPYFWAKTEHGRARRRSGSVSSPDVETAAR